MGVGGGSHVWVLPMTTCLKIVAVSCEMGLPTAQKGPINRVVGGQRFTPDWSKVVKTSTVFKASPVWCFSELLLQVHVAVLHFRSVAMSRRDAASRNHYFLYENTKGGTSASAAFVTTTPVDQIQPPFSWHRQGAPKNDRMRRWVTFILCQQQLVSSGGVALLTELHWFSCGLVDTASAINNSPEMRSNTTWKLNSGRHMCAQLWSCPNFDNKSVRMKLTPFGKLASVII